MHLPPSPPGLEHVERYWDSKSATWTAKLLPGEYYVALHREQLVTVVGSAAAVYLTDPKRQLGALNHFVIPDTVGDPARLIDALEYGHYAMDLLIDSLLRQGSCLGDLRAVVVGGSEVHDPHPEAGREAVALARRYLAAYGIPIVREDVGEFTPRKIICRVPEVEPEVAELTQYNETLRRRYNAYHTLLSRAWMGAPAAEPVPLISAATVQDLVAEHQALRARLEVIDEVLAAQRPGWLRAVVGALDRLYDLLRRHFEHEQASEVFTATVSGSARGSLPGALADEHEKLLHLVRRLRIVCDAASDEEAGELEPKLREVIELLRRHERIEGAQLDVLDAEGGRSAGPSGGAVRLIWPASFSE